jgi:hypothetical protein
MPQLCTQNIVLIVLAVILIVSAIGITWYATRESVRKSCHVDKSQMQMACERRVQEESSNCRRDLGRTIKEVAGAMGGGGRDGSAVTPSDGPGGSPIGPGGRPMPGLASGPGVGLPPRIGGPGFPLPWNQLTQGGYLDDWHYVGYVFPKKDSPDKRFPLYARRSPTQRHAYDYFVIDDSRNRIRINIEVPKNQFIIMDGDLVRIDSEPGEWVARIDVPADLSPLLYQF